jgi:hypothetical protein
VALYEQALHYLVQILRTQFGRSTAGPHRLGEAQIFLLALVHAFPWKSHLAVPEASVNNPSDLPIFFSES